MHINGHKIKPKVNGTNRNKLFFSFAEVSSSLFSKLFLLDHKPALSFKFMDSLHLLQGIIYSFEVHMA